MIANFFQSLSDRGVEYLLISGQATEGVNMSETGSVHFAYCGAMFGRPPRRMYF
jgi:hypothetical protein